jgi:hypothetical protein
MVAGRGRLFFAQGVHGIELDRAMDRACPSLSLGYDQALTRKKVAPDKAAKDQFRYGIGEWYGHLFAQLRHRVVPDPL